MTASSSDSSNSEGGLVEAMPSLLQALIPEQAGISGPCFVVESPARAGRSAKDGLMAHALQGQPMGRALFADLGTALASLHQTSVPSELMDSATAGSVVPRVQTSWAAWLSDDLGSLPPLPSPAQEAMRQRFLSRHGQALKASAQQVMASLDTPLSTVDGAARAIALSHGALALDHLQALPEGRFRVSDSPVAGLLPRWWDVGGVLAWLPLLAHVHYSAVHYEPIVLTAYLKAVPPGAVEPQYDFVRSALQVAGLTMAALVLSPDRLPWLKDVYLKETFLKQAVTLVESPSQVDWLVQLPQ